MVSVLEESTDQARTASRKGATFSNNSRLKDMPLMGTFLQGINATGCIAGWKIRREYARIIKYACGGSQRGEECGRELLSPFS